jgi:hypothetical protein
MKGLHWKLNAYNNGQLSKINWLLPYIFSFKQHLDEIDLIVLVKLEFMFVKKPNFGCF